MDVRVSDVRRVVFKFRDYPGFGWVFSISSDFLWSFQYVDVGDLISYYVPLYFIVMKYK